MQRVEKEIRTNKQKQKQKTHEREFGFEVGSLLLFCIYVLNIWNIQKQHAFIIRE